MMTATVGKQRTYGEQRSELEKRHDARILARVKRGIAWLEETEGPDWVDRIDLSELDLRAGAYCVLGQVFGEAAAEQQTCGYVYATRTYPELRSDDGASHGFTASDYDNLTFYALQSCWAEALTPLVSGS